MMQRSLCGVVLMIFVLAAAGCARGRQETIVVHQWRGEQVGPLYLETFLDEHPLPSGEALRFDEIGRSEAASYHIVQIRGRERAHRHQRHDLTAMLLSGEGRLYLGSMVLALRPGAVVTIPRGVVHYFVCSDPEMVAVAYVVSTPPLDEPDADYLDGRSARSGGSWRWRREPAAGTAAVAGRGSDTARSSSLLRSSEGAKESFGEAAELESQAETTQVTRR